jgi:hypothetical protein
MRMWPISTRVDKGGNAPKRLLPVLHSKVLCKRLCKKRGESDTSYLNERARFYRILIVQSPLSCSITSIRSMPPTGPVIRLVRISLKSGKVGVVGVDGILSGARSANAGHVQAMMDSPHCKELERATSDELSAQTIPQAAIVSPSRGKVTKPPLIPGSAGMEVVKQGQR